MTRKIVLATAAMLTLLAGCAPYYYDHGYYGRGYYNGYYRDGYRDRYRGRYRSDYYRPNGPGYSYYRRDRYYDRY
jgi:hypothetical protein